MEGRRRILIVDDMPSNIKILNDILRPDYNISVATTGPEALKVAAGQTPPDLVLLDIMMPDMDGYEVCAQLKTNPQTQGIPVLFVTALGEVEDETRGLALGAVDYITKPISPPIVKARINTHMRLKLHQDHLEDLVLARTRELALTQDVTIHSLAGLAETRDNETGGHIMRTQHYVRSLAIHLSRHPSFEQFLDEATSELIFKSAPLHDIGKVGVPDAILLKPGPLTPNEFEVMKRHAVYGRDAILKAEKLLKAQSSPSFLRLAREIVYTHHEKWDGSGYPQGLAGQDIPIPGRLMAVADVYDALVTKRVYKPALPRHEVMAIMIESRGRHFDPEVLDAFLAIEEVFRDIAVEFADNEEERRGLMG
jgi:putative two-component system response regulator